MSEDIYESWCEEKQSVYIYNKLAAIEKGTPREALFKNLAQMADDQAGTWMKLVRPNADGAIDPRFSEKYQPTSRVRFILYLAEKLGPERIKMPLAALKVRGLSVYSMQHSALPAREVSPEAIEVEDRHRMKGSAGNLRAAIFGINDGLLSNASLMVGVAAAANYDTKIILMSGGAGLLAGALSMAAGEYISVRSQCEMLEYQLGLERAELDQYPEEEALELALIYEARGIPKEMAVQMANHLIANPVRALETLAREELGLDPSDLGSPWGAALSSFGAFAIGGLVPVVPFLVSRHPQTLFISLGLTGITLFTTGALVSLFSGRGMLWSGLRMLFLGVIAGTVTYLIGTWMGVHV